MNKAAQRPILFSTPMVKAILKGTKTETRRTRNLETINNNPNWWRYDGIDSEDSNIHYFEALSHRLEPLEQYKDVKSPYGKVGDILWVRETFAKKVNLSDDGYETQYLFKASSELKEGFTNWKPSIHMPMIVARIWLEITSIRVERLNDIHEVGAIAEGIQIIYDSALRKNRFRRYPISEPLRTCNTPIESFQTLWESINGPKSWNSNPWVWVIQYKQIEKPEL